VSEVATGRLTIEGLSLPAIDWDNIGTLGILLVPNIIPGGMNRNGNGIESTLWAAANDLRAFVEKELDRLTEILKAKYSSK